MRPVLCVALAALAVAVVACGDDEGSGAPSAAGDKPAQLDVAYIEVTSAGPLMLGVEKGFFEEEGLDLRPKPTEAAGTIPAVVSGDVDITFTNPPATLLGAANGLPLKVIGPAAEADPEREAYIQLLTRADSGIESPADLAGKKVAVDTLFQLPHIALLRGAEAEGADPSTWKFTEIPFPAMAQALKSGKVDAAFMGEPFLHQGLADGNRSLMGLYAGWEKGTPFSMYVTSERFLAENGDAVERFARALERANEYAQQHEDELRQVMPTFLEMPEQVAQNIVLPVFAPALDANGLETWKQVMTENKVLEKDVDVAELTGGSE